LAPIFKFNTGSLLCAASGLVALSSLIGCSQEVRPDWAELESFVNSDADIQSFDFCDLGAREIYAGILNQLENDQTPPFDVRDEDRKYLLNSALTIASKADTLGQCREGFSTGYKLFEEQISEFRNKYKTEWIYDRSPDPDIKKVQDEIHSLVLEDQAVRNSWIVFESLPTKDPSNQWAKALAGYEMSRVDVKSLDYMRPLMKEVSWIEKASYGETTSYFAWFLVQHADKDPKFQKTVLNRMRPLLSKDEISKSDYAYLYDRVAVNTGEKQLYGTQSTGECVNDLPEMRPIKDIDNLDKRRAEMELGKHSAYLNQLKRTACVGQEDSD